MSFAGNGFDVAVLELPYIFGTQPGRKPVWVFLVENIRSMKKTTMWPKGGSTMVTVKQVGQAIAGALERNRGGKCYPIGYYNMEWKQCSKSATNTSAARINRSRPFRTVSMRSAECSFGKSRRRKVSTAACIWSSSQNCNVATCLSTKRKAATFWAVQPDDIESAIGDSVKLCADILDNKAGKIVAMKGE